VGGGEGEAQPRGIVTNTHQKGHPSADYSSLATARVAEPGGKSRARPAPCRRNRRLRGRRTSSRRAIGRIASPASRSSVRRELAACTTGKLVDSAECGAARPAARRLLLTTWFSRAGRPFVEASRHKLRDPSTVSSSSEESSASPHPGVRCHRKRADPPCSSESSTASVSSTHPISVALA